MRNFWKVMKVTVFSIALFGISFSISPLFAQPAEENQDTGGGSGGGSAWTVTCNYNGSEVLISKSCTSGGSSSCKCP